MKNNLAINNNQHFYIQDVKGSGPGLSLARGVPRVFSSYVQPADFSRFTTDFPMFFSDGVLSLPTVLKVPLSSNPANLLLFKQLGSQLMFTSEGFICMCMFITHKAQSMPLRI